MKDFRITCCLVISVLGAVILLTGCAETRVKTEQPGSLNGIKTVLILTFEDAAAVQGDQGLIKCPLCGNYFEAGKVPPDSVDRLTQRTLELLQQQGNIMVLTHDRNVGIGGDFPKERLLLTRAGKSAGADAVLAGYVYRYEDRIGSDLAVKSPASVALSLHLVRVVDGLDIWSGYIDETQQALTEDLFKAPEFFRRKGRWVSADEMADTGLTRIFESFPKQ